MVSSTIPSRSVFVWFGSSLPLFAELAIRSVLRHDPGDRVVLYSGDGLKHVPPALKQDPRFEVREIRIEELLKRAGNVARSSAQPDLDTERLRRVWNVLTTPAARSNMVRLLDMYSEGGVYLDTDTLTLKSLAPLRRYPAFCGMEYILWPWNLRRRSPIDWWVRRPLLTGVRGLLSVVPGGHELNRPLLSQYTLAVNNAVLGFHEGHPALHRALQRIAGLARSQWTKRYRLGSHLMQEVLGEQPEHEDGRVHLCPPEYFYPVGPVLSAHYFRRSPDPVRLSRQLTDEKTYVIHWYASVSNLLRFDQAAIRKRARDTVFAHLCLEVLEGESPEPLGLAQSA